MPTSARVLDNVNKQRETWDHNKSDGDGVSGAYESWKLWDPSPADARRVLALYNDKSFTHVLWEQGVYAHVMPRFVRLSDSGIGLILSRTNAPQRSSWHSVGHAWLTAGGIAAYQGSIYVGDFVHLSYPLPVVTVDKNGNPVTWG
ncbi:MAG: hypothetical protein LQ346_005369 [Caloplaca aetnensis]|nr:MAG: hypothetical protein LQ346_005369 [Caloplaca aetnensis]